MLILIVWEFTGCYRPFGLVNFGDFLFANLFCNKVYKLKLKIFKKNKYLRETTGRKRSLC